jgi:hypothetical protein
MLTKIRACVKWSHVNPIMVKPMVENFTLHKNPLPFIRKKIKRVLKNRRFAKMGISFSKCLQIAKGNYVR